MKKLLLTGFEPFLEFPVNPTEAIVKALNDTMVKNYTIHSEVLTVDFQKSGPALVNLIEKHNPDAVVCLGLAAGRNCITPERIAINCNDGPKDNSGFKPDGEKIFSNGPDAYFSTLPIKSMVAACETEGIPCKISNTAGTYLCNNVMYHALHHFHWKGLSRQAGFIHIPASHELAIEKEMPSWSHDDLVKAVKTSLQCL